MAVDHRIHVRPSLGDFAVDEAFGNRLRSCWQHTERPMTGNPQKRGLSIISKRAKSTSTRSITPLMEGRSRICLNAPEVRQNVPRHQGWGQDQLPPVYVTRRSALSSITAAELANRRIEILAAIFQGAEQPNPLRGAARPSRIQSASPGGPSDPSPDRATSIQDHLLLRKIAARNPLTGVLIWPTPSSLPRSATKSYQG